MKQINKVQNNNFVESFLLLVMLILFTTMITIFKIPGSETLRWVSTGILGGYAIITTYRNQRKIYLFDTTYIFLFLMLLPSLPVWFDQAHTFYRFISFIFMVLVLTLFFGRENVNLRSLESYMKKYAYLLYLLSLLNIYYYIKGINFISERFWGVFSNPNALSCITLFILILSVWLYKRTKNIIHLLFTIMNIIILIGTGSRAGLIILAICFILYPLVFNSKKGIGNWKVLLLLAFFVVVGWLVINNINIDAFQRLKTQGITRDEWLAGYSIFKQKPFFGWGYGLGSYYINYDYANAFGWGMHNSYLLLIAETGMWGGTMFLLFLLVTGYRIVMSYKFLQGDNKVFVNVCLLILFSLSVNAISEAFLFSVGNPMSILFWFTLLLVNRYIKIVGQNNISS